MEFITLIELMNPHNNRLEIYDATTNEQIRAYPLWQLRLRGKDERNDLWDDFWRIRNIKVPSWLEESRLWC